MRPILGWLTKPRAEAGGASAAAGPAVTLNAGSPAEATPQAGLIVLEVTAHAAAPLEATLIVREGDRRHLEKPLQLSAEPSSFWLAVHSQLLPNGAVPLALDLIDASGRVLAQRPITLQVRNRGPIAGQVAESLRRSGAPAVLDGCCDSGVYDYQDPKLTPWFDKPEPEALAEVARREAAGEITGGEAELLRDFVRDGYLTMPGAIDAEHLTRLNAAVDAAVADGYEGYVWGSSQRMHGLHETYPAVRELCAHPKILRMLSLIYGAPALPAQSLTYAFGSQQEYHQDTVHLTAFPAGYMNGVWTALEDVQPDSGELVVFPTSHRMPRVYTRTVGGSKVTDGDFNDLATRVLDVLMRLLEERRPKRVVYQPKAGDVLIWHENLLHGGQPRSDMSKSRRSVVCHYFAEGAVAYLDSLGVPGVTWTPAPPDEAARAA